jgi:ribosomal protein L3 glutamine methyltransferase
MQSSSEALDTLSTIKDFIRWGASQFSEAGLFFGHGTANAIDDAAAIVLHTLNLPYQLPDTYLDARITRQEKEKIMDLFNRRIHEKTPSAYLTHEAVFANLFFFVDKRVIVPRSPIAEFINEQFSPWVDAENIHTVLDLCTGSGCIAIACAHVFHKAKVDAVDFSKDALEVAGINVEKYDLNEQVFLQYSDLFTNLPEKKYDLIISNPPYVSLEEWQVLPAEFHAEPEMSLKGGDSGLDLVIKILAQAEAYLSEKGILVVEVGSSAETLQNQFPTVPFYWLDFTHGGEGVFLLTADQVSEYQKLFNKALNT